MHTIDVVIPAYNEEGSIARVIDALPRDLIRRIVVADNNSPDATAANAAAAGAGFGLLVWTVSYLGLMPALDLHPPATRDTARRNLLMIVAHLVWGATAGVVVDALRD